MKIAGIIAEYNPFHSGHAWHISQTRRISGCDYVVVCMAGHFTQRGEPAIYSKWRRAEMALRAGADAVFELPALFAVRSADAFAGGGVSLLSGLGADVLSFGSEIADPVLLGKLAALREREPEAVTLALRGKLATGMSHPRAWGGAVSEYLGVARETLMLPNVILGMEYLRALKASGSGMEPLIIRRRGSYHAAEGSGFLSAEALRKLLKEGETERARAAMPEAVRPLAHPVRQHGMDDVLLYRLRGMSVEELAMLPDIGEGLEHRLHRLSRECGGRDALLAALKCKRYTYARLSRLLTHALLGLNRAALEAVPLPPYGRLIGLRRGAEELLSELDRRASVPIVSRAKALRGEPCFELECRATDMWALMQDDPARRVSGMEYTRRLVSVSP